MISISLSEPFMPSLEIKLLFSILQFPWPPSCLSLYMCIDVTELSNMAVDSLASEVAYYEPTLDCH